MDVGFDLYKVFYYVCEFKSVTKASNYLRVSQPAVTKHIKNLESIVGANLIVKVPKGIELTSQGEQLYNEIKKPIEKLIGIKTNNENKVIRISAGNSITQNYLLDAMINLNKKNKNLRFSLGLYYYKDSIQKLRDGKLDIIFLNLRNNYNFGSDLIAKEFITLHDIFVISKDLKNEIPSKINLIDLNEYPLICKYGVSVAREYLENEYLENKKIFEPRYNVSNHFLIEKYVEKGLGIGLVTKEFVKDKLDSNELIEIKTDIKLPVRKIAYAVRKNNIYNNTLREFINEIKSYKENKSL